MQSLVDKEWDERRLGDLTRNPGTPTSGKERWQESEKEDDKRGSRRGSTGKTPSMSNAMGGREWGGAREGPAGHK